MHESRSVQDAGLLVPEASLGGGGFQSIALGPDVALRDLLLIVLRVIGEGVRFRVLLQGLFV